MEIEDQDEILELNNDLDIDLLYILTNNLKPIKMNMQSLFLLRGITMQLDDLAKSKKRNQNLENESFKQILKDLKCLDSEIKNNTNINILTDEEKPKHYLILNKTLKEIDESKVPKINRFIDDIINLQNSNKNTLKNVKQYDEMEIEEEIDNEKNEMKNNNKIKKKQQKQSDNNELKSKKDISIIKIPKSIKEKIENIYYEDKYTKSKNITYKNKIFEDETLTKTESNKRNELMTELKKLKKDPKSYKQLFTTDIYIKNENTQPIYSKQFYLKYEFENIKITRKYIWFKLIKEKPELNLSYYIITKNEENKKETFHIYIQSDINIYLKITKDPNNQAKLITPFNFILDDNSGKIIITPTIFTCQSIKVITNQILDDKNYLTNMNIEKTLLNKTTKK